VKRLRWTPEAATDLERIRNYLDQRHPHLAQRTVLELYERIRTLKATPHLGRPGRIDGTRELIFASLPYIAVYRVKEHAIEILHIHHTAQDWPPR
jgi:toxin ParE1/3/4